MAKNFETLEELTGQESGIIIRGNTVIVANWSHSCPQGGLPVLAPWGLNLIAWPLDEIRVAKKYDVDDIRTVLPGSIIPGDDEGTFKADCMEIVYDAAGDIPALWGYQVVAGICSAYIKCDEDGNLVPTAGKVYKLDDDTIVIAPEGWC